jgi:hypothetical protein
MENLQSLETGVLLEMLSGHNADYAKLLLEGSKEEFEQCKDSIHQIQQELNSRRHAEENPPV